MVALKPSSTEGGDLFFMTKQERRGGIETSLVLALPVRGNQKQERRGGIETGLADFSEGAGDLEAGTPWWH